MKKIICIGFVIVLFVGFVLTLLLPDQKFSDMENRNLAQLPNLSVDTILSGKWMTDMESYLADQFPARDFFVSAKAQITDLMGNHAQKGAYRGKNGRLFEQFDALDHLQLDKNIQALSDFISKYPSNRFVFLPVYSAFTIYPQDLPPFAPVPDERAILNKIQFPQGTYIADPLHLLLENKESALYFKLDHHWTQQGAYLAYTVLADALDFTPAPRADGISSTRPFQGSLYSKIPLWTLSADEMQVSSIANRVSVTYDQTTTTDTLYEMHRLDTKDQYSTFLDGNHARVDITSDAGTDKTLIVVKDSFAHALVPYLAANYDTIIMLDLRYYNLPPSTLLARYPSADVLLTYNLSWLANDAFLYKLKH